MTPRKVHRPHALPAAVFLTFVTLAALAACGSGGGSGGGGSQKGSSQGKQAEVDTAAESRRIKTLDDQWQRGIHVLDTAVVTEIYAKDAVLLVPGSARATGHDAIVEYYRTLFASPDLVFTIEPATVVVGSGGEMAYDIGTYRRQVGSGAGQVKTSGNYLALWKKVDGRWRVAAESLTPAAP